MIEGALTVSCKIDLPVVEVMSRAGWEKFLVQWYYLENLRF